MNNSTRALEFPQSYLHQNPRSLYLLTDQTKKFFQKKNQDHQAPALPISFHITGKPFNMLVYSLSIISSFLCIPAMPCYLSLS